MVGTSKELTSEDGGSRAGVDESHDQLCIDREIAVGLGASGTLNARPLLLVDHEASSFAAHVFPPFVAVTPSRMCRVSSRAFLSSLARSSFR